MSKNMSIPSKCKIKRKTNNYGITIPIPASFMCLKYKTSNTNTHIH